VSKLIKCMICGKELHDVGLGTHLKKHNLKIDEYYDKYLKITPLEGICKICGKPTKFRNIYLGYSEYHNGCVAKDSNIQKKKKDNFLELPTEEQIKKRETKLRKYKETSLEKFGTDNYFKTEEFQEKREKTCLRKFGVTHQMKAESIKIKFKKIKSVNTIIYPFYCEFCDRGFLSKKAIATHLHKINKKTTCRQKYLKKYGSFENFSWNKKIKCNKENCSNMIYPGGKTGFCHKCSTKDITKNRERNAKLTTKKLEFIDGSKVDWKCEFCKISFDTKGDLEKHSKDATTDCNKLFYQKYRILTLFPWNNYSTTTLCKSCGLLIPSSTKTGLCKRCSNQWVANNYQLGNPSYQKILDVYNKFYTKKFYDQKFRSIIWNEQVICPICGCDLNELIKLRKIHLHHIDFNKLNDNRINLVFLCNSCHTKTTWNRIHFIAILEKFNYILIDKIRYN